MEEDVKLMYRILRYLRNYMEYSVLNMEVLNYKYYNVTQPFFERKVKELSES